MAVTHSPFFLEGTNKEALVMFIHGFMGSPKQFVKLAGAAHMQGFSVAALLLPGHSGSVKEFASCTFERWQDHVLSEVERYSRHHSDIWLVGHSMGGLLAINAAVAHNEHVRGVFMLACPFKLTMFSAHAVKVRMMQVFGRRSNPVKAAYRDGSGLVLSPRLILSLAKPMNEVKRLMQAARENLPYVRVPVTAVYSASDELTNIASMDILKSELTAAPLETLLLVDSFHAYYTELEQEVITEALIGMISA